ncbi:HupE/UreJ family protein [Psychromonas aquatilis]|uniref:HupE/UreJ family protein n=1 Tax=Psychromonas aquatilis TaxID=2005072 RepID=A0ABU9GSE2_9GAMM
MKQGLNIFIAILLAFPSLVFAHEIDGAGGFTSGFSHPVLGFDHLLAMLSVGILSAQMGGKAIWKVPATFVVVMLFGGVLGMKGIDFISVELGIVFSVLALGIAIAANKQLPAFVAMIFVGFFAIFHGHAHGTEMPYLAEPMLYALGFVVGTAVIHIAGVVIGSTLVKFKGGQQLLRLLGAGISGVGFHMLVM